MEIIERINVLLKERGKLAVDLCKVLDIRTSTMSTWKAKKTDPPAKYMPTIASFFGVSLDYLLTGKEVPVRTMNSSEEDELLELFRALPVNKKYEFIGELKGFLKAMDEGKKYLDEDKKLSV